MTIEHPNETIPRGNRKRMWLIFLTAISLPVLAFVALHWMSTTSTHSQVRPTLSSEPFERSSVPAGNFLRSSSYPSAALPPTQTDSRLPQSWQTSPNTGYRTVVETSYRDEEYVTVEPVTDAKTGEVTLRSVRKTRQVPVQSTRMVLETDFSNGSSQHDPKVFEIIAELRGTEVNDRNKDIVEQKQRELHELLGIEFDKKHNQQTEEIAATEERITDLKTKHKERGENREMIISRRIDQLLGKANPLDWDAGTRPTVQPNFSQDNLFQDNFQSNPVDTVPSLPKFQLPRQSDSQSINGDTFLSQPNPDDNTFPSLESARAESSERRASVSNIANEFQAPQQSTFDGEPSSLASLNDMFTVIGNFGQAILVEQSFKLELESTEELKNEGALPQHELQKAVLKYETSKQRTAILKQQVLAIRVELQGGIDFAKEQLSAAETSKARSSSTRDIAAAEQEHRQAEFHLNRAKHALTQYDAALKQIGQTDLSTDSPQADVDPESVQDKDSKSKEVESLGEEADGSGDTVDDVEKRF